MTGKSALLAHLQGGETTVCRCWLVVRPDGERLGFTDHDRDLSFDGDTYRADTGMTARAFQAATGLAVDNSEAVGALRDATVAEADLAAGRFDGAAVTCWLVNWADVGARMIEFRGNFGEITRIDGLFRVELRGLSDALSQRRGRVYQRDCSAVLGDARCGFDLGQAGYRLSGIIDRIDTEGRLWVADAQAQAAGWFERGVLQITSGAAQGLTALIKADRVEGGQRALVLWTPLAIAPAAGDGFALTAGCDRTAATCRSKFANFVNFRGFPHVPGEDWLAAYPVQGKANDGGSLSG